MKRTTKNVRVEKLLGLYNNSLLWCDGTSYCAVTWFKSRSDKPLSTPALSANPFCLVKKHITDTVPTGLTQKRQLYHRTSPGATRKMALEMV